MREIVIEVPDNCDTCGMMLMELSGDLYCNHFKVRIIQNKDKAILPCPECLTSTIKKEI